MKKWILPVLIASLAVPGSAMDDPYKQFYDESLYNIEQYKEYIEKAKEALGEFDDIKVFERGPVEGKPEETEWKVLTGQYIPVSVDGKEPDSYEKDMRSDRPMMLPTRVEGFEGGDGQSSPYTVVGRMPGSNPEVQWLFLVRQYDIKKPKDDNFAESGDMAVIGHHPRTGASIYFQFYWPTQPKSSEVVISPFNKAVEKGMKFWAPLDVISKKFLCQRCHNADPFIHTPWIDQVRVRAPSTEDPFPEPMVPSNPFGPFFFVDSEPGELYAHWNETLRHLNNPENQCTQCHRVTPYDMTGLYQNSSRYAGLKRSEYNEFSVEAHGYQTDKYRGLQWMPPVAQDNFDFYAGQEGEKNSWYGTYGKSAVEVNTLTPQDSLKLLPVPRPPAEYQQIVVDRPLQDEIAFGRSLWILDKRMRANADATLDQWRFFGKGSADSGVEARPVVYRSTPDGGFTVEFIGAPRGLESSERWVSVKDGKTFDLNLGDYLGMVLTNSGTGSVGGIIPYTQDDWARPIWSKKGGLRVDRGGLDKYATYQAMQNEEPMEDAKLDFGNAELRTYSFEFRNRL